MPSTDPRVGLRWLRLLLLGGALGGAAAGQYWLSVHHVARWAALGWAAGVLCFVLLYALGSDARQFPSLGTTQLSHRTEGALFVLVFAIGVFFTVFRLTTIPPGLNHDAAWEGMYAIRILNGAPYRPYVNEAWGRETFTFYLRAISIWLMGPTRLAVTVPSTIAGVLILPLFYWWARNMFGVPLALLAMLFLGTSGWHLVFSRTGWRSDFQPIFMVITCCFFIRGMLTTSALDFALSGVGLALTLNTYNASRAFPLLFPLWLLLVLGESWHWRGFVRRYGVGLAAMAAAFSVVVAPLAWFAIRHWNIFQSRAVALEGTTTVVGALKETALLFNYWGNGDDFFTHTPGLEYPTAIFLVFGFLWCILRLRDDRAQFLVLGFVIDALPGFLSKPNMNRDIGTMPFVYFFVALGVLFFALQLKRLIPWGSRALAAVFAVLIGLSSMAATYAQYLGPHRRHIWGFYPQTTVLGEYIKTLVPRYQIWVGDVSYFPRDALTYLSYQGTGNPELRNYTWVDDARRVLFMRLFAPPGKGLAFVFDNAGRGAWTLTKLAQRYPHHEIVDLRYPRHNGRVFAKALLVPPAGAPLHPSASVAGGEVTEETRQPTPPRIPAGELLQPRGVAATRSGDVIVCDFGHNRLQEFGPQLRFVSQVGSEGLGSGEFKQPCGVAVGGSGDIFVADTWNQRVQVFSSTGKFERQWTGGFFGPRGIAVNPQGDVFVVDTGNNRVVRFSAAGRQEAEWGGTGRAPGKFLGPVGIAADAAGRVYVCDNGNARLQIFSRDGKFVRAFAVPGWVDEPYSEPYVAIDGRGTLWVTVPKRQEIRNYNTTGKLLRTIRGTSIPGHEFDTPMGITYNAAAHALVISDLANRLVSIPYPVPGS